MSRKVKYTLPFISIEKKKKKDKLKFLSYYLILQLL